MLYNICIAASFEARERFFIHVSCNEALRQQVFFWEQWNAVAISKVSGDSATYKR